MSSERVEEREPIDARARTRRTGLAVGPELASAVDVALERALEGLFRLSANRRFSARQAIAVGAVVTRAGYAILRSLHDRGALSVRGLADACAMDAATASRQLMPLVDEGLVERRVADADARQVEVRLTSHGEAVYARLVEYRLEQLTGVLETWSETDRATLARLVERLGRDLARLPRSPDSTDPSRAARGRVGRRRSGQARTAAAKRSGGRGRRA
ncbi:MAG: MarR family transcriptional regulator [Myxococcota bacterium]